MVSSGFRNFYFRNRFVTEMLGTTYGLSRELRVGFFVWYLQKTGLSGLSPDYFRGQAWPHLWPRMTNVCYCHKFNDILKMLNYVIYV